MNKINQTNYNTWQGVAHLFTDNLESQLKNYQKDQKLLENLQKAIS